MDTRYGEGKSYAAFSYPGKGENQRGYIVSSVLSALPESDEAVGTWMRYTHKRKRFQYPVTTALTASTQSKVDKEDTFIQLYHDLQIGFEQQPLIKVKTYEVDEGVEVLVYEDEYDSHGNIIRRSDINRDGSVSYTEQYEYDDHDNLINKIIYTSGGVLINQYQLELDEAGKVIKRIQYSDNNQLTGYDVLEYDDHGNEIKEVQYDSKDNADSWIERNYDDEDKLIRTIIHYQDTATIIDYTYDSYGRLTKESRDENYTSYEYNSASSINPSKVTEYADGVTVTGYVRYEYDYYGNLTRCTQCNPEGIVKHEFVYENIYGTEEDSEYK